MTSLSDYQRLIIQLESLYRLSMEHHNGQEAIRIMRGMVAKGQRIFSTNIEV